MHFTDNHLIENNHLYIKILFLTGLTFIIGPKRTFFFFVQWDKMKGTFAFFTGIFIVLSGHPVIGVAVEAVGFYLLFKSFIPKAFDYIVKFVPFLGYARHTSIV